MGAEISGATCGKWVRPTIKRDFYAGAGIPEYRVVECPAEAVEIFAWRTSPLHEAVHVRRRE